MIKEALNFNPFLRKGIIGEGNDLTRLALRSKSYWNYSQVYLDQCWDALHLNDQYIQQWPVVVLEINNEKIGFYALKNVKGEYRLDHLWVDRPFIGKGYGKFLLSHAIETAKSLGWKSFRLAADPGAESFYLKQGAVKLGSVQSRIKPDLFLPHLEFKF